MAAQSYKICMLTARDKYRHAVRDVNMFHNLTDSVMATVGDLPVIPGDSSIHGDPCRSKLLPLAHMLIFHTIGWLQSALVKSDPSLTEIVRAFSLLAPTFSITNASVR
jgi:hypothetical protein